MKTLLLIPSILKTEIEADVAADLHPRMDYDALTAALDAGSQETVVRLDYAAVDRATSPLIKLLRRFAGRDIALAAMGFQQCASFDAVFTNGENVSLPLALLLKCRKQRPRHVTIGHRLSTGKKRLFFTLLQCHRQMDTIFVYARTQYDFAVTQLGIRQEQLRLIAFHADDLFYRPASSDLAAPPQICSAGLEWRDYPTLIEAVKPMTDLKVCLAAASPWSKHTDETANRTLPAHVTAQRYNYAALRVLYARSEFVVVPLYENDFQAGVTTILEAMAMGKAVIATQTTGQVDVITDGENGLTVMPGDVAGWQNAIQRLRTDTDLRRRLGQNARCWIEQNATLDCWVHHIMGALHPNLHSDNHSHETENITHLMMPTRNAENKSDAPADHASADSKKDVVLL